MHRLAGTVAALLFAVPAMAQTPADVVSTREVEGIDRMEFKEAVPSRIRSVK